MDRYKKGKAKANKETVVFCRKMISQVQIKINDQNHEVRDSYLNGLISAYTRVIQKVDFKIDKLEEDDKSESIDLDVLLLFINDLKDKGLLRIKLKGLEKLTNID